MGVESFSCYVTSITHSALWLEESLEKVVATTLTSSESGHDHTLTEVLGAWRGSLTDEESSVTTFKFRQT